MWYSGSGQITQASEMYKNGQLGFFAVPDVDGQENMETNVPIHGGFGTAFNAKTYDDTMKEFFEYMCNHYSEGCYNDAQVFHRLMMRFRKDWISYSMICSHCLKMLQMLGYPGMTNWIPQH